MVKLLTECEVLLSLSDVGDEPRDDHGRWTIGGTAPRTDKQRELFDVGPREPIIDPNAAWETSGNVKTDIEDARDPEDTKQLIEHHLDEGNLLETDIDNTYTTKDKQQVVTAHDGMADIQDANRFIYDANLDDYFPDQDQRTNDEFWESPGEVYHATQDDNVESIQKHGLKIAEETRGFANAGVGPAVYTTANLDSAELGTYGDSVFAIDCAAMKRDGLTHWVDREPACVEEEQRDALANRLGIEDFHQDAPMDGEDPDTFVIHGNIPAKYLRLIQRGGREVKASDPTLTCPTCGSEDVAHCRSMRGNALCNICEHIFTDPNYGKSGNGVHLLSEREVLAALSDGGNPNHDEHGRFTSKYEVTKRYSGHIPEITRMVPSELSRFGSDDSQSEVDHVSDAVAKSMKYDEPIEVAIFKANSVDPNSEDNRHYGGDTDAKIVDGHHRWSAARQTGRSWVPVTVKAVNGVYGWQINKLIADSQRLHGVEASEGNPNHDAHGRFATIPGTAVIEHERAPVNTKLEHIEHRFYTALDGPPGLSATDRAAHQASFQHPEENRKAISEALAHMTPAMLARVDQNLGHVKWFPDLHTLQTEAGRYEPNMILNDVKIEGFTRGNEVTGKVDIHLDGPGYNPADYGGVNKQKTAREIYAHELGHVIDGPEEQYSNSDEWIEAANIDIIQHQMLTRYACESAQEAFAETVRAINTKGVAACRARLPHCMKVIKDWGLV